MKWKKFIEKNRMSWNDITLGQYNRIKDLDLTQIDNQITAAEILLGINADNLTWVEFGEKLKTLDFLSKPMPQTIIRFAYELNGHKYVCRPRVDELSVSQFMDFTSLSKTGEINKILGVFLIPEGKEYGDYDIEAVWKDILSMSVVDAMGVFNFFQLEFQACVRTLADFSIKMMRKGMKKEDLKLIKEAVESVSMDFCSISDQQ